MVELEAEEGLKRYQILMGNARDIILFVDTQGFNT